MPKALTIAKRPAAKPLPKLPKHGYKGVRRCGRSFQGYTPKKTKFTRCTETAREAALLLANCEYTQGSKKKLPDYGTSGALQTPTGERLFFASPPSRACRPLNVCCLCVRSDGEAQQRL